MEDEVSATS